MGYKNKRNQYIRGIPQTESRQPFVYTRKKSPSKIRIFSPKALLSILISVTLMLTVTGTVMYLVATTDATTNAFSMGNLAVEIVEPGVDPEVVPWGATTKPVYLSNPANENSAPGIVRAMIIPTVVDKESGEATGAALAPLQAPTGTQLALGDFIFHFSSNWSSNWFYQDGYFYYKHVLVPGQQTTQLLAGVTLRSNDLATEYADKTVTVEVLADILQINGDLPGDAWNVSVSSTGVVTPG